MCPFCRFEGFRVVFGWDVEPRLAGGVENDVFDSGDRDALLKEENSKAVTKLFAFWNQLR